MSTLAALQELASPLCLLLTNTPTPGPCPAPALPQVADLIKSDRLNRLNAVVNRVAEERAQRFAGRDLEVLVEGANPRDSSTVRLGVGGVGWGGVGRPEECMCRPAICACGLRPCVTAHQHTPAASAVGTNSSRTLLPAPPCSQAVGRTRHNKLCYFPGDGAKLKGQLVHVHVDRVHAYTLYGRLLD